MRRCIDLSYVALEAAIEALIFRLAGEIDSEIEQDAYDEALSAVIEEIEARKLSERAERTLRRRRP